MRWSPKEFFCIIQADSMACHIITVSNGVLKKLNLIGKDLNEYSLDTVEIDLPTKACRLISSVNLFCRPIAIIVPLVFLNWQSIIKRNYTIWKLT